MARQKVVEEPVWLKFQAEARVVEQLDLVGRSTGLGRLGKGEMLRTALQEFVNSRMADDSIRHFVESQLRAPALKLSPRGKNG